jgi:hypothetical protein
LNLERQPLTAGELKLAAAIDNYIKLFRTSRDGGTFRRPGRFIAQQ